MCECVSECESVCESVSVCVTLDCTHVSFHFLKQKNNKNILYSHHYKNTHVPYNIYMLSQNDYTLII